jgi:predicted RNase H-like HicB family nuclease
MSPSRYSVFIAWSEADEAYIAKVFELPGCMAHGDTRAEAIAQVEVATQNWLDTARELGRAIPEPRSEADLEFFSMSQAGNAISFLGRTTPKSARAKRIRLDVPCSSGKRARWKSSRQPGNGKWGKFDVGGGRKCRHLS